MKLESGQAYLSWTKALVVFVFLVLGENVASGLVAFPASVSFDGLVSYIGVRAVCSVLLFAAIVYGLIRILRVEAKETFLLAIILQSVFVILGYSFLLETYSIGPGLVLFAFYDVVVLFFVRWSIIARELDFVRGGKKKAGKALKKG